MFSFRDTQHHVPYLMCKESQASDKLSDLVRSVGAPRVIVNGNECMMTGKDCFKVLRTNCIDDYVSEAYHHNQNLAERWGKGVD